MNIIALGKTACNLVEKFKKYPQYKVYKISIEEGNVKEENHPEQYDQRSDYPVFDVSDDDNDVDFFVSGDEIICAASLRVLEHYKNKTIRIFYLKPNIKYLSDLQKTTNKIVYNVLQEYTRSNKFDSMYIFEYENVIKMLGKIPIIGYYDKLNTAIVDTIHMINFFDHNEPVLGKESETYKSYCICTIGIMDFDSGIESNFYALDNVRENRYYYSIKEAQLQTDGDLWDKINTQLDKKATELEKTTFSIYSNSFEYNTCYIVKKSPYIQT
jgi:hypothetical protein